MKLSDLPTCGSLTNGTSMCREIVKALSYAQIMRAMSPTSTTSQVLADFFRGCAALCEDRPADETKPTKGKK